MIPAAKSASARWKSCRWPTDIEPLGLLSDKPARIGATCLSKSASPAEARTVCAPILFHSFRPPFVVSIGSTKQRRFLMADRKVGFGATPSAREASWLASTESGVRGVKRPHMAAMVINAALDGAVHANPNYDVYAKSVPANTGTVSHAKGMRNRDFGHRRVRYVGRWVRWPLRRRFLFCTKSSSIRA